MTLYLVNNMDYDPTYIAVSGDIVDNKISGAAIIGATIYLTDTQAWKIVLPDLTLDDYVFPT